MFYNIGPWPMWPNLLYFDFPVNSRWLLLALGKLACFEMINDIVQ